MNSEAYASQKELLSRPSRTPVFRLAVRMLIRDLRAGNLRLLFAALLIAVTSVATVGFFADRVYGALNQQATAILGGDLTFVADHPVPKKIEDKAKSLGLEIAKTIVFPSMVSTEKDLLLSEIKVVGDEYPLRGKLRIAYAKGAPEKERTDLPARDSVWVSDKLLSKLNILVGDKVQIGEKQFVIGAILTKEPDSTFDYFNVAPRIMMNADDIAATGLLAAGSRAKYRLLVAGDSEATTEFHKFVKANLGRGERIETVKETQGEVRVALERAEKFLGLASLLSVILAAVGVALAARRFMQRELDTCAVFRCLGASQAALLGIYLIEFLLLGIAVGILGCLIGFGGQFVLVYLLTQIFYVELPLPTIIPAVQAFLVGMLLLAGFAIPPLVRLRSVPTLRVLRREMGVAPLSITVYLFGFMILAGLLYWKAGDTKIWLAVMTGISACLVISAVLGWVLISILAHFKGVTGVAFRYGLASLNRRKASSIGQISALGLGIMALLLLTMIRNDLMTAWQNSLPKDTPNRFVVNIQRDQLAAVQAFFAKKNVHAPAFYPMIRGRLLTINGKPIKPEKLKDDRARRLAEREFNLSFSRTLRVDNQLVEGAWWSTPQDKKKKIREFSVEEGIAKALNIKVGDRLTYNVAGTKITGKVANIRKVDWESFKVNFFVIGNPEFLEKLPASYITSFHLPKDKEAIVNELVHTFPNLTIIDVGVVLDQVRSIADQVSRAIEFVFAFTLIAGIIVLCAAIAASQDERIYEAAVMRTLGAKRSQLLLAQLAEFITIGFLAGIIAAFFATAVGFAVSIEILELKYDFNILVPATGVIVGAIGVVIAGFFAIRDSLNKPPLQTIRGLM